jgi:hypothetical protein
MRHNSAMKPKVPVIGLCVAGVVTLSLDCIAKTFDPQAENDDTFQLITTSTGGATMVKQNTISIALIEIPAHPAVTKSRLLKRS